ncbi:hypothetical protein B0T18DRAFT_425386 [Schizothecium vesticola]|uniref:Uncharacterized protein n=1 Tax=Schizothecium vesticola TaxID=314040 RepID=A0AA40FCI5_9PEZI|nr:hypothetical protein B0T18DRAFT_425386 [Schizothecium vesticola]
MAEQTRPRRTPEPFQIIQFVNPAAGSVNFIRSHAARVTHARRRRARHAAQSTQSQGEIRPPDDALHTTLVVRVPSPAPETIGSGRSDPFGSFSRPLHPMESFLLDHYIAHIVPIFTATCRGLRTNGRVYAEALTTAWVQMGLHDAQCLNSLFLTASRHLAVRHEDATLQGRREIFTGMAVRYKVMSVRAVSRAIAESGSGGAFQDVVFMETLALAFDEVLLGEAAMMRRHVQGALDMVRQNGGWDTLGLGGFLEMVMFQYLGRAGLLFQADFPPEEAARAA